MKALVVSILENKRMGNCSNHGISEKYDYILLVCEDGNVDVRGDEENLCKISFNTFGGQTYYYVRPMAEPKGVGYMSGGSFVWSSDSRFPFDYPLALHDRCETQEQYDALSH